MKLRKITVEQLFGTYTYTIPLWEQEAVTILHSPNGHGKTTILKLVEAVMEGNLLYLDETPFFCIELVFDDGIVVRVRKNDVYAHLLEQNFFQFRKLAIRQGKESLKLPFVYEIEEKGNGKKTYSILLDKDILLGLSRRMVLGRSRLEANIPQEPLSLREIIVQEELEDEIFDVGELYVYLLKYKAQCNIHIIEANRVFKHVNSGTEKLLADSVQTYAKELGQEITVIRQKAGELSEELDQTFPERVLRCILSERKGTILSQNEIQKRLETLEKRRKDLIEVGILSPKKKEESQSLQWIKEQQLSQDTRCFLSIYIEDTEKKLACYTGLKKKINILLGIINVQNGFSNKTMKIEGTEGAVFYMDNGTKVPLHKLSSGEKNDFVLFYELIFKCNEKSLILIDEPEISLHIAWQQEFIRQLMRICGINQMQALVATHSPNIVDEYWDLLVDLEIEEREEEV